MAQARRLKAKITRAYVLALLVIASLSMLAYLGTHRIFEIQGSSARTLSLATRQLAYPPRAAALIEQLARNPLDAPARRQLASIRAMLAGDHQRLVEGDAAAGVPPLTAPPLRRLYFEAPGGLDGRVRRFLGELDRVIADPRLASEPAFREPLIREVAETLPHHMRAAIGEHAALARSQVEDARQATLLVLMATLAALLLEGLLIFRPLASMIARRTRALMEATASLEHAAIHDKLTGLTNRDGLKQLLARRFGAGAAAPFGLLHLDLDRFGALNYAQGHSAGDAVLEEVARRLSGVLAPDDVLARTGGDEFMIVKADCDSAGLETAAERVRLAMAPRMRDGGVDRRVTASMGLVCSLDSAADDAESPVDRLLMDADIALIRAKSQGDGRVELFTSALREDLIQRQKLGLEIREALETGGFEPFVQPQVYADGHGLAGFEALARWRHPERGLLAPGAFLPVAEDLMLVDRIDAAIMSSACAQARAWRDAGLTPPRISVNLSARRLAREGLVAEIRRLLERHDLPPEAIGVEILESVMLERQTPVVAWNVAALADMGVEIELDDFGTGHASLANLRKLRPNGLKIDRGFVIDLERDPMQRDLIEVMLDLARRLGVRTVAEGVETQEQAEILRELGCEVLQGFYFAKPLAVEDAAHWLTRDGALGPAAPTGRQA